MQSKLKNSGYTLVEMMIYVAILSLVSLLSVSTVLSFTRSYRDLLALRNVEHAGLDAMEKMTRDIRSTTSIDDANSVFGTTPGVLTIVATANSVSTTTKFYLQNGIIKADVNGSYFGPLTPSNASTTSLVFTKLNSGIGFAVKVDMAVSATVGTTSRAKIFHSTIIARGL